MGGPGGPRRAPGEAVLERERLSHSDPGGAEVKAKGGRWRRAQAETREGPVASVTWASPQRTLSRGGSGLRSQVGREDVL